MIRCFNEIYHSGSRMTLNRMILTRLTYNRITLGIATFSRMTQSIFGIQRSDIW